MAGTSPQNDAQKKKQEAIAKARQKVSEAQTQEQKDAAQAELTQAEQMPN
jgi:hypothetical protein